MNKITLGLLTSVIAASSALAGEEAINKDYKQPAPPAIPCFKDQELQLDLFGSFMNFPYGHDQDYGDRGRFGRGHDDNRDGGGGGVGVNYFFMRYFGVGVDGDFDSNLGGVANYTGKIILRLPIETHGICIAPYVFGGGGGESFFDDNYDSFNGRNFNGRGGRFDRNPGTLGAWMVGGGVEWRVTPRIGVFAEGRYTWTGRYGKAENGLNFDNDSARLGVRFAF